MEGKIESELDCDFCGDVGIHELRCPDKTIKTNKLLDKRLDKNARLKNFQQECYARKKMIKGKPNAKGYTRDTKEHFVFGQNVTEMMPSKIANALFKRDAEKYHNLQFEGKMNDIPKGRPR